MGVSGDDCCGKCGEPITGKALKAKERIYHEENCFSCCVCKRDLKAAPVYSRDDQLYCEKDYREKFVPKCAQCNDFVLDVSRVIYLLLLSYTYKEKVIRFYHLSYKYRLNREDK